MPEELVSKAVADEIDNRWREGYWGYFPERVPMHVKEALHFGWSRHFALLPVRLGEPGMPWAWLRTVERREVHAPGWFLYGYVTWTEYRNCHWPIPSRGQPTTCSLEGARPDPTMSPSF